ncbi:Cupin domain-containing protein [Bryocella elongata]|uniref:Cupin domain-containing protein n=1 Tax=Bryocella elongata TaxID=863522 RepID=A0A1H5SE12_9BACT|nr:cupin domain-containing protein [Bryocella elongata]SEF48208.1 Cupin domain-containing protein [Bryocella elongata]
MLETGQTASSPHAPTITPVSRVFHLSEIPLRKTANGGVSWDFGGGQLTTGEWVRVHESAQMAGGQPSPAHTIDHTELICILEGEIEFLHNGTVDHCVLGDILLVAKGTNHQLKNVGTTTARYFVLAIGGDVHV